MADIFRAPLYSNRREVAPVHWISSAVVVPALLATLLAAGVTPLPFRTAQAAPLQVLAQPRVLNGDTSQGTPKTLTADKQAPFAVATRSAPERPRNFGDTTQDTPTTLFIFGALPLPPGMASPTVLYRFHWQPPDTGASTPKALIADSAAPIALPILQAPEIVRSVTDTSRSSAVWLPTGPPPLPPGAATPTSLFRVLWQPLDTGARTPKTLTSDATTPFAVLAQPAPERARDVRDTARGTPVELFPAAAPPLPPGAAVSLPLHRFFWQPPDANTGIAKPLIADATVPFAVLQQPVLDRVRPVADTSVGSRGPLLPAVIIPLPPGAASYVGAPRLLWQPQDASLGTAKTLVRDAQQPFSIPTQSAPERTRYLSDTTADTWIGLLVLPLPPGASIWTPTPARPSWVVDTSRSAYATTKPVVIVPLPPGQAAYWVSHRFNFTLRDTSASMPRPLFAPVFGPATLAAFQRPPSPSARPLSASSSRPSSPNSRRR